MHEMSLVRSVVSIVKEEAEAAGAAKVNRVHIVLGEGRDIVLDYFESLFRFLARGTVAENAEIEIHPVPLRARCNVCNAEFHLVPIDKRTWTCPECGAFRDYQLTSGMEFYISKIEAARQTEL